MVEYGGECEECSTTSKLEFAHKETTGLNGWGRGRKERVYDVIKNPDKYRLLCKDCHKRYDQINGVISMEQTEQIAETHCEDIEK